MINLLKKLQVVKIKCCKNCNLKKFKKCIAAGNSKIFYLDIYTLFSNLL